MASGGLGQGGGGLGCFSFHHRPGWKGKEFTLMGDQEEETTLRPSSLTRKAWVGSAATPQSRVPSSSDSIQCVTNPVGAQNGAFVWKQGHRCLPSIGFAEPLPHDKSSLSGYYTVVTLMTTSRPEPEPPRCSLGRRWLRMCRIV